jgi:hypothetical protein
MVSNGMEGYLVGAQSMQVDIVQRLLTLSGDSGSRAAMGAAAQRRIAAQFTAATMFGRYRSMLNPARVSPTLYS